MCIRDSKKPFTWDYDYKERYRFADDRLEELDEAPVRAAFEAVGKSCLLYTSRCV